MIRVDSPLLLIVVLAIVAFVAIRLRNLPPDLQGVRRVFVQILSLLAIGAVGLALCGFEIGARLDRLSVVFLFDQSRSVERSDRSDATKMAADVQKTLKTMKRGDQAGIVVFGAEAQTISSVSERPSFGAIQTSIVRDQTDIAAGIQRALAELPEGSSGRIVLMSDGVSTRGDAIRTATVAAGRGVIIDVVPLERDPEPEIALERVHVPTNAHPDEPVEIRMVTRANKSTPVRVRVMRNGKLIARAETEISKGNDVLTLEDQPPGSGVYSYEVLLDPVRESQDSARENNSGAAILRVSKASTVLILTNEISEATALGAAIEQAGLEVTIAGPNELPTDMAHLAQYDLVVLSDFNARWFSEDQLSEMAAYVRHIGGGMLMVGSRNAFGMGGYAFTPVEEVLPATFQLKRRRERASLSMIIAIDRSGSMSAPVSGGRNKLDLANEAAARSAKLMAPFDRVGVMHVDTAVNWTVKMRSVDDPDQIAQKIYGAQPGGGGIFVDVTLTQAYDVLRAEKSQLRHLLLFSDGSDSEKMGGTKEMVKAALRAGITTSVVSMGKGMDTAALEELSKLGDGRFFIVEDMRELPQIFTQETVEASRSAIVEEPFRPIVVGYDEMIRDIEFDSSPPLLGYSVVTRKPRSSLLLAASEEDPLLLAWHHGLGQSAVFATDGGAKLAQPWINWPGYSTFYGQISRSLARSPDRDDFFIKMSIDQGRGRIQVESVDSAGRYRNYLNLKASVVGPNGKNIEVPLSQTSAALYEGTFDASVPGFYLSSIQQDEQSVVGRAAAVSSVGDELRGEGTDLDSLSQIAALTGGKIRGDLETVFTDRPPPTYAFTSIWDWLVLAAMVCLLLNVALRRLYIPRSFWDRLIPSFLRRKKRAEPSQETFDALKLVKKSHEKKKTAKDEPSPFAEQLARKQKKIKRTGTPNIQKTAEKTEKKIPKKSTDSPSSLAEKLLERKRKKR